MNDFEREVANRIAKMPNSTKLFESASVFMQESTKPKYSYNFSWMGRPIIQYPQDMVAMQEIIWDIKPDLIIETGIAHGGSLIFYASLLEMLSVSGFGEGKVFPAWKGFLQGQIF